MAEEFLRGECVCISASTPELIEMGVPEGCGALIIAIPRNDHNDNVRIGAFFFSEVIISKASPSPSSEEG